ncbi:Chloroperoxidase [Rhodocollybia butyracea]|uniref:Chloroperoxidase n=1 Tax=Rhodocollybia butyracea TaxID=206335 RepID=A0A9P5PGA9_9AGAR|nr:Chloroperoxidase [Rhodocollybia butyracea]
MAGTPDSSSSTSTLPPGHPPVHEHSEGQCPINGNTHAYCPPQKGDLRSVCPALNAMANHGYIRRDGQHLTSSALYYGLKDCYGLSSTLSAFLVTGGFLGIKRSPFFIPGLSSHIRAKNPDGSESPGGVVNLHLIGLHNGIEHDGSLVHLNTPPAEKYAPVEIQDTWVPKLVGDILPPVRGYSPADDEELEDSITISNSKPNSNHDRHGSSSDGSSESSGRYSSVSSDPSLQKYFDDPAYLTTLVDEADIGRMRARRQREILPDKLDAAHAEIARGEMSIMLGVWSQTHEGKTGIPLPWLLRWLSEERLPEVPVPVPAKSHSVAESVQAVQDLNGSGSESSSSSTTLAKTTLWRPNHKQMLSDVVKRNKVIRAVTEAIESGTAKV